MPVHAARPTRNTAVIKIRMRTPARRPDLEHPLLQAVAVDHLVLTPEAEVNGERRALLGARAQTTSACCIAQSAAAARVETPILEYTCWMWCPAVFGEM